MSTNTNGKKLYDACLRAGMTGKGFDLLDDESRQCFEQAAAEYDKARAQLPDDVEAFVAECEARTSKATRGPWKRVLAMEGWDLEGPDQEDVGNVYGSNTAEFVAHSRTDVPRLIAIVRAQGAELAAREASEQGIIDAAMKARFDLEAIGEENKALRNRLAKLEKAGRDVVRVWLSDADWGPFVEALEALESVLKVTENGMTETSEERKQ